MGAIREFTLHSATIKILILLNLLCLVVVFTLHSATIKIFEIYVPYSNDDNLHYTLLLLKCNCYTEKSARSIIYITLCYY